MILKIIGYENRKVIAYEEALERLVMQIPHNQKGLALLVLVFLLALVAIGYGVNALDSSGIENQRNKKTATSLKEAKNALIGSVIGRASINDRPYLPNPSLALVANSEGKESLAPLGGATDISLIGKFPWSSLGTTPIRDGWGECLWYAVSGTYKNTPETSVFNWDTQGQFNVIDANGNIVASNLAALIIAPGPALEGQERSLEKTDDMNCGGNYDAKNYLDTFDSNNAVAGAMNYFSGSALNRIAPNTDNKTFVLANNDYYNDQFIFVSVDDLFNAVIKRSDFKDQIDDALSDPVFHTYLNTKGVSGSKGTDNIDCSELIGYETFCNNWVEMLLFTKLPTQSSVTIDGVTSTACTYVLLFGGKKTIAQDRTNITTKSIPSNYLEGANVTAFNVPIANSNNFVGVSAFDPKNPNSDILKCI